MFESKLKNEPPYNPDTNNEPENYSTEIVENFGVGSHVYVYDVNGSKQNHLAIITSVNVSNNTVCCFVFDACTNVVKNFDDVSEFVLL